MDNLKVEDEGFDVDEGEDMFAESDNYYFELTALLYEEYDTDRDGRINR
jgi:hypothetical protein